MSSRKQYKTDVRNVFLKTVKPLTKRMIKIQMNLI